MGSNDQFAMQKSRVAHVRFGSKADIAALPINVRFTPNSGHRNSIVRCLLCAKSRHYASQQNSGYSITSSARSSNDGGMVIPRDLAVLRLITKSNLVGSCTGKSDGLSPLRIRPT